jgi:hypothetical protein
MHKPIDRAIAKDEIERIDDLLVSQHILIGGLAVQQYCTYRGSKDIDLVCDFETSRSLVKQLYPSRDWDVNEPNENDYRPSYHITHKSQDKGIIVFGPKITEREPYEYISWEDLQKEARPFKLKGKDLKNVFVPSPHALAYTKLISFLSRHSSEDKRRQDLEDFSDLTNHKEFSSTGLFSLLEKSGNREKLAKDFFEKSENYREIVENSCLFHLASLFHSNSLELGLFGIYDGDRDRAFESALRAAIKSSKDTIVFIGWGLAFIAAQNRPLIDFLKQQVRDYDQLKVYILMPTPDHPGLVKRIEEEEKAQRDTGILGGWPTTFWNFLSRELQRDLNPNEMSRIVLRRLPYLPTATILKLDERFFFRPYGPPNQGGWASPWLEIKSSRSADPWQKYLQNSVEFGLSESELLSSS